MSYARLVSTVLLSTLLCACRNGSEDSSPVFVITGSVSSPGGIPLEPRVTTGPARAGTEYAGLLPVPDGTEVALVALDVSGEPVEVLARGFTVGGEFTIVLVASEETTLQELGVVAGTGATRMRAFLVDERADVAPTSEATFALALAQGPYENYSDEERLDLVAALELVGRLAGVVPTDAVASTVALFRDAALAEPDFLGFLGAAAAAAGTTTAGPGDLGEYFPLQADDVRGYAHEWFASASHATLDLEVRNLGESAGVWTLRRRDPLEHSESHETYRKGERELVRASSDDPREYLPEVESRRLAFPLRRGKTWLDLEAVNTRLPVDVDADGLEERADAHALRTLVGFEELELGGETFPNCAHVETVGTVVLRPSRGGEPDAGSLSTHEWYAPGIGLVRRELLLEFPRVFASLFVSEELSSRRLAGAGRGVLPPNALATLDADSCSGLPGVASDGEHTLVVSLVEEPGLRRIMGYLLSPESELEREFLIHQLPSTTDCPNWYVQVAFDGANYVVPFAEGHRIVCVRVSPAGDVLDATPLPISDPGALSDSGPRIASDGTNSLVVWTRYGPFGRMIHGALVAPDGTVLRSLPLLQGELSYISQLAFGGGQYLLAWVHGYGNGVYAMRLSTTGERLDPAGIVVRAGIDLDANEAAVGFDGENWLVAFTQEPVPNGPTEHLVARRIAPDGTLLDPLDQPPLTISSASFQKATFSLHFDGESWLVAWTRDHTTPSGIQLTRLSRTGEPLDGPGFGHTLVGPTQSSTPYRLVDAVLTPGRDHLNLLWVFSPRSSDQPAILESTRIYDLP